jgi:tetratricopeptide (TPR) repeat protein
MDDLLDRVRALKAAAKTARDNKRWEEAIGYLQDAISLLKARMADPSSPRPSWLRSELSDAYGLIGGIEKRRGLTLDGQERQRHLEASLAAYDAGFEYEEELQRNEENTYNRVNRLVGRVLLDPGVLEKGEGAVSGISRELGEAETILTGQIQSVRQRDPWAYCDLGTIRLLRGKQDALRTFKNLDRLRPPAFVYKSTLNTLEPLRDVAADRRPDLVQAVEQLRRSAGDPE